MIEPSSSSSTTMNDLPKEVTYTPVPYIGLVGLDPSKNSIHAAIWNTLAINRTSERLPLYYKLIADNYEFAAFKSKVFRLRWPMLARC